MNQNSLQYAATPQSPASQPLDATYRKIAYRLLPILFLSYVVSYLDRQNIGFAKLQMQQELNFSDSVFGLGASIFFLGYILFEVPSNILLHKLGARRWIARIMISWGLISALMFVTRGPVSFYVLRLLLGVAEAGLVPGAILYLSQWFPASRRARVVAIFYSAVAVSGIVGGPVSGWLMQTFHGAYGLSGWQWLFISEGLPSVLMGLIVWRFMVDSPDHAGWLSPEERMAVKAELAVVAHASGSEMRALADPQLWLLIVVFFMLCAGITGVGLWMPTLVQATGVRSLTQIGLLTAVPYLVAIVAMFFNCRHSDRTGERRWHVALPMLIAAMGLALAVRFEHDTVISLVGLTLCASGILCSTPPFWSLPVARLSGRAAAVGVAMVTAMGSLGSFASPYFIGLTRDLTHSTAIGIYSIAAGLFFGGLLILAYHRHDAVHVFRDVVA
ncbi:MFS transporter [Paraburkholderia agricolaris]|uniref:MFS transporter n=1 Tax=Paraburkholderia agricolaris TaxID=2152888 RepID=UPI0012924F72|nr:MFS transporter [Paraburkholderia agricolaris]